MKSLGDWFKERRAESERKKWVDRFVNELSLEGLLTGAGKMSDAGLRVPEGIVSDRLEEIKFDAKLALQYVGYLRSRKLTGIVDRLMRFFYASSDVVFLNQVFMYFRSDYPNWAGDVRQKMVNMPHLSFREELLVYGICDKDSKQQNTVLSRLKMKPATYNDAKELYGVLTARGDDVCNVLGILYQLLGVLVFDIHETIWLYNILYQLNPDDPRLPRLVEQALSWLEGQEFWWKCMNEAWAGSPMEKALIERYQEEKLKLLKKAE